MSLERIIEALITLGLSRLDSEIYVYVTKKASTTIFDLRLALNYPKNQIKSSIERLIKKGIVIENGTEFIAVPFEEALELLIKKEKEKAQTLHESKKELLAYWKNEE